jgi:periplasmic divalent cation tolerance protein
MKPIIVITTFPSLSEAHSVIQLLIEKRLIACAQIYPEMTSVYRWESKVEQSKEYAVHLKTFDTKYSEIEKMIKERHSYDVPEIISIAIENISKDYLEWMSLEIR